MSVVRYEDFARMDAPMRRRAGDPAGDQVEILLARARGQARADGFAEGVAQTEARAERETAARLDAILAALKAEHAARAAAAADAREAAISVLSTFLRAVAPRLAEFNLAGGIAGALDRVFADAPEARPLVEVAPEARESIAAALTESVEIAAAGDLGPTEARIRWRGGFDLIDAGGAMTRALAILDAHLAGGAPPRPISKTEPDT
ncbi:MAG: hypothetical protein ACK5MQ_11410 [Pikeienuella sp.]